MKREKILRQSFAIFNYQLLIIFITFYSECLIYALDNSITMCVPCNDY